LDGRPPVLRRDTAAIPVLLDLVSTAEGRARYRAATALARNVWSDGPVDELHARPRSQCNLKEAGLWCWYCSHCF
jgi:hypothetical protein